MASTVLVHLCGLFTDDNEVIGSRASHVTGSAQVDGLERWNSYENFSGLSTSQSALASHGEGEQSAVCVRLYFYDRTTLGGAVVIVTDC